MHAKKCGIDVNTLVDGPLCMYVAKQMEDEGFMVERECSLCMSLACSSSRGE